MLLIVWSNMLDVRCIVAMCNIAIFIDVYA